MAFKRAFAQRLLNVTKMSSQTLTNCRISSSSALAPIPPTAGTPHLAPDPGDNAVFRRLLHNRADSQTATACSPVLGQNLVHKLKEIDIARNRLRLDGLLPPAETSDSTQHVTAENARKLFRAARLELVRSRLRSIQNSCIPYPEFLRICEDCCSDRDQAVRVAKMLDDSATVVILGDIVFLRPEQVAKAVLNLFPIPGANAAQEQAMKELEEMEKEKAVIDGKADGLVRRELWSGLSFLVLQTAAFMRLTFWELSWDVMEPICFFVTSIYFMGGYAFFLRTSREPSFEGYYKGRFIAKQKRLMKLRNFDMARYNELRAACFPHSLSHPPLFSSKSCSH
ncbi:calcium uniporter protein 2, mitochondrial [Neltuma alba]|uniref:calcium uniporter protein 2, mitochondrial n=1 Tax=Neltuma alba TaxID=207710 RepID=UPI0010A4D405|nr:calcium uniporter protein 2, mitochondrial-like [Prosopis alba]